MSGPAVRDGISCEAFEQRRTINTRLETDINDKLANYG